MNDSKKVFPYCVEKDNASSVESKISFCEEMLQKYWAECRVAESECQHLYDLSIRNAGNADNRADRELSNRMFEVKHLVDHCHDMIRTYERMKNSLEEQRPGTKHSAGAEKDMRELRTSLELPVEIFRELVEEEKRANGLVERACDARDGGNVRLSTHLLRSASEAYDRAKELSSKWVLHVNETLAALHSYLPGIRQNWRSASSSSSSTAPASPVRLSDGHRYPVYILVQTGLSMTECIDEVESLLKDMYSQLCADSVISEMAAISVVEFNSEVHTLIPLCRLKDVDLSKLHLTTCGQSLTGQALKEITKIAKADLHFKSVDGYQADKCPLLIIISNGVCTDENGVPSDRAKADLAAGINELRSFQWGEVIAYAAGSNYDQSVLESITGNVVSSTNNIDIFRRILWKTVRSQSSFEADKLPQDFV